LARLGGFAALFVCAAFVRAGDLPVVECVDGRPEAAHYQVKEPTIFLWHHKDGGGWHLAATTAGLRHHFKGHVWLEGKGKFGEIKEWKGHKEVKVEEAEGNWFHKNIKRHENDREFTFDVTAEGKGWSGVFFGVEGPGPLKWDLEIGGASDKDKMKKEPGHVLVGKEGQHPQEIPFQTYAHPDEKGHGH
jgi:hypothetical protein